MPTWTFTTTDPDTALKLSTFCVGLGHVTETETPDKPAPVQRRAAKPPVDHGCWRDPEARKVRAKVNAWANAKVRSNGSLAHYQTGHDEVIYADAMGWTREKAKARIEAHREHLEAFAAEQRGGRR